MQVWLYIILQNIVYTNPIVMWSGLYIILQCFIHK